jgi:membrane-associated phospholipid phosphatase
MFSIRENYIRAACLAACGVAALRVDLPLSNLRPALSADEPLAQLLMIPELFGDGLGVVLILSLLFLLRPDTRPRLPRVIASVACTAATANLIKLLVWRTRPRALELAGGADSVLSTFAGTPLWTPWSRPEVEWHGWMTSFPSAHTATAVGLAFGLGWLYPRYARWFAGLAFAVAAQRVVVGAHFLSDTLFGAAAAMCVAPWVFHPSFAPQAPLSHHHPTN